MHPATKTAAGLLRRIADQSGQSTYAMPSASHAVMLTLIDNLMIHPVVKKAFDGCCKAATKRVLGIDAQFSTMMGVLYQIPHGINADRNADQLPPLDEIHCIQTVRANDTVLLTKTKYSESFTAQLESLDEAVGPDGHAEVELLFSDNPSVLDTDELFVKFPNLECVVKDPIHIPLKLEQSVGETHSQCSNRLRMLMRKFIVGYDDGIPYYIQSWRRHPSMCVAWFSASRYDGSVGEAEDRRHGEGGI